ncbi:unnamed protein product [Auanema sp. JU1783]|nr:unnamed protein product [Auanema sp. JU1783]
MENLKWHFQETERTQKILKLDEEMDDLEALRSLSVNDHSEKYPLLYYTIPVCLMSAMMDNNQIDIVTRNAKQYGGIYFVLLYFLFNFLVGFASIELFVGIAQYTRAGMTKIFGLYARLFRCVGVGMLVTVFCFQSAALHRTADKFSFIYRNALNPSRLVTCNFTEYHCPDLSTKEYEALSYRECCTSVYHAVKCPSQDFTKYYSIGDQCVQKYPSNIVLVPAALISETKDSAITYDTVFVVSSIVIITVVAIIAMNGITLLTIFMAGSYYLTTLAIVIYTLGVTFGIGNLRLGLVQIVRLSEIHKLFQIEMLVDLTFMCFSMVALKFFILSIACYLHQKYNASTWSTIMYGKRTFIDILFLLANLSMQGTFEKHAHHSTVSISKDVRQYARLIPEFFGAFSDFGFFFYLYYVLCVLMNIGQIAGPYFICYTLAKDHFPSKRQRVVKVCVILLTMLLVAVALTGDSRHSAFFGRHVIQSFWGSCFLVLAIFAIAFLYGPLELILDRFRIMKITARSRQREILDTLSAYRIELLRLVITPILTLIVLFGIGFVVIYAINPPKDKNKILHYIDVAMILFPVLYFIAYQIFLQRKRSLHKINFEKLIFPTKHHPSYARIVLGEPNTLDFQSVHLLHKRKIK